MAKTVKFSVDDHRTLKILSAETDKKIEDLASEAVALLQKKYSKKKPAKSEG